MGDQLVEALIGVVFIAAITPCCVWYILNKQL